MLKRLRLDKGKKKKKKKKEVAKKKIVGILEQKKIVLLNYPLGLSLLKYRNVWVFWNIKKSDSNRCSPLNSSIDNFQMYLFNFYMVNRQIIVKHKIS